ncbi:Chaperone protein DnaJ [uncultured archaeon]|nr:Chaperone protein DnaJ [uncultured archaeon]
MSSKRDYYETLGLPKTASVSEIKSAYRKLAMQYHPDKNKDAGAEEKFKEISEAYAVLSNEEKRKIYDQYGHQGFDQRFSQEDIFRNADFGDFQDLFRSMGFGFGDEDDPMGSMFGSMFGMSQRQTGRHLSAQVSVTLKEAASGATRTIEYRRQAPCDSCKGSGAKPGAGFKTCSQCHGRGQVQQIRNLGGFGRIATVAPCPACHGRGQIPGKECDACSGKGYKPKDEHVDVQVPAGIEDGMRLRLNDLGETGPDGPGDLLVRVHVEPDERFERDGEDLHVQVPISYTLAVLGGKVKVPTLDGEAEMTVPAGTPSHSLLRLRGEGLPRLHGTGKGDLLAQVIIEVPKHPDARTKELLRELEGEGEPKDKKKGWF